MREVMKLCVVQGMQACNLGVPILATEPANRSALKGKRAVAGSRSRKRPIAKGSSHAQSDSQDDQLMVLKNLS
jgi:hypothetical protein